MNISRRLLVPPILLAGLAVPAVSQATTYCAHSAAFSCPAGQVDVGANLSMAFSDPDDGTADTLNIHAGSYQVMAGGLTRVTADPLTVVGDGQATTQISGLPGVGTVMSGSRLNVSGLTFHLPGIGAQSTAVSNTGSAPGVIQDITVDGGTDVSVGVHATGPVTIRRLTATLTGNPAIGVEAGAVGGVAPTVTDSTLSTPTGWGVTKTGTGGTLTIRRVSGAGRSLLQTLRGGAVISDSSWETYAGGFGALDARCQPGNTTTVELDHVTFSASSGGTTTGIYAECDETGGSTTVTARNSIFSVLSRPFRRIGVAGANASITVDSSLFLANTSSSMGAGTGGIVEGSGNVEDFDPFVNWPTDLHLRASSPAIDAGDPGFASQPTDLDGNPRPVDGDDDGVARQDMGAYERQPAVVPPTVVPPAATPPSGGPAIVTPSGGDVTPPVEAEQAASEIPPVVEAPPARLTVADLQAMLLAGIRGGRVRHTGGVHAFAWPAAGRITVTWTGRAPHAKRAHLLARGTIARTAAGSARLTMHRTRVGRRELRKGTLVTLRAAWAGGGLRTSVTLRRRAAR